VARNKGLEELIDNDLAGMRGITTKPMFGGMAWLANGNLLCGARDAGMLVRLGKDGDAWALKHAGIARAVMGGRTMLGWVRADQSAYADDRLRAKLLHAALEFNRTLPKK
jgi:TfoX/Sxy family transcriptional regulator of competence genes